MNIAIRWGSGWMTVDAVRILYDMPLRDFKKWCKMLAQFGEEADKDGIVKSCRGEIQIRQDERQSFESDMQQLQGKIDGTIPTVMAKKYLREQLRLVERHRNGAARKLTSLEEKYSCLKDVLRL